MRLAAVLADGGVWLNRKLYKGFMDKRFNGLRYSSTLGCLVGDGGEKICMGPSSTQVFILLKQNLNKLVTREHLLNKVPTNEFGSDDFQSRGSESDARLTECIEEIRLVVGEDRLKTIPRVGYLLTSDVAPDTIAEKTVHSTNGSAVSNIPVRRTRAMVQELIFNSQWIICTYQKNQHAWLASLVLLLVFLFSPVGQTANTKAAMGHMAYDGAESSSCAGVAGSCNACLPGYWQTSSVIARSNWMLSTSCTTSR